MRVLVVALVAAVSVSACSVEHVAPGERSGEQLSGSVSADRVNDAVRITNGTDRPIAYHVWPRGYLGLFSPCADPGPSCVNLASGASVTIPISTIEGIAPTTEAITVRWWRVEAAEGGGHRAGAVSEIDLEI